MPTLLDTINQNRQALQGVQVPDTNETAGIQSLMAAKSGKAGVTPGLTTSNLGEQSANATAQAGLRQQGTQIGLAGAAQNLQGQAQQQQYGLAQQQIAQQRKFNTAQTNMQATSILNNLSMQKDQLSTEQKQAGMEQAGFLMSMQNQAYVDKLNMVGQTRRLDNQVNFQNEMQSVAFGDALNLVQQKMGQNDILGADSRDFAKAMSDMSIQDADKIASIEMASAQQMGDLGMSEAQYKAQIAALTASGQAQAQGLSGLATAGTKAVDTYQKSQEQQPGAGEEE